MTFSGTPDRQSTDSSGPALTVDASRVALIRAASHDENAPLLTGDPTAAGHTSPLT